MSELKEYADSLRRSHGHKGQGVKNLLEYIRLLETYVDEQLTHHQCHDVTCSGSRKHPRYADGVSCSCKPGFFNTDVDELVKALEWVIYDFDLYRNRKPVRDLTECLGFCKQALARHKGE